VNLRTGFERKYVNLQWNINMRIYVAGRVKCTTIDARIMVVPNTQPSTSD